MRRRIAEEEAKNPQKGTRTVASRITPSLVFSERIVKLSTLTSRKLASLQADHPWSAPLSPESAVIATEVQ